MPEWAALFALGGGICDVHLLRFISSVTPANLLIVNMAAGHVPHMHVSTEVEC